MASPDGHTRGVRRSFLCAASGGELIVKRVLILTTIFWMATITVLHLWLNLDVKWFRWGQGQTEEKFRIGFLPVT